MHRSPAYHSPTRSERKTIAFITLFFIGISALFHFALGNLGMRDWWQKAVTATSKPVILQITQLETPTPTPRPRPSPTAVPVRATPRPITAHSMQHPPKMLIAPPRRQPTSDTATPYNGFPGTGSPGPIEPLATDAPSAPIVAPATPAVLEDHRDMIVSAEFEHRAIPEYPEIARAAHWEGTVIVLITIGPQGMISAQIGTSSGFPSLDNAALVAAKESTYRPPEVNGTPAIETYRVIYTFTLNDV